MGDLPGARDVELRWGWSQAQGVDTGVQQSDQHSPGQLTAPLTPSLFGSLNRPCRAMRVARWSASWLSSHGRGLGPQDACPGLGSFSRADRGIGGVRHVAPPTWLVSNFLVRPASS